MVSRPPAAAVRAERRGAPDAAPFGLIAILGLMHALRVGASWSTSRGDWGLDTLATFTPGPALALVALGAVGFVPPLARRIEAALDTVGRALERSNAWTLAGLGALVAGVLFAARDPIRFVGDASLRLSAISVRGSIASVFPQASPLDVALNIHLPRLLHDRAGLDDAGALQAVGATLGGLWTVLTVLTLRAAGGRGAVLAATALTCASGATLVHFAGYGKFAPLLVAAMLAAWGVVTIGRDGPSARAALAIGCGAALAPLAHRSGALLWPAAALALVSAWRRATGRERRTLAWITGGFALVVALVLPAVTATVLGFDRVRHLTGGDPGGRVRDALQLLAFAAPVWPAGLAASLWGARRPRASVESPGLGGVAALALVPALAALALVRGSQGAPRDWDMHLLAAMLVTLVSAGALVRFGRLRGALAPLVTVSLAAGLALWGIHTDEGVQSRRIAMQLGDRRAWGDEAWARACDFMGVRAMRVGANEDAVGWFRQAIEAAPNARYFYQIGLILLRERRVDEAADWIEQAHRRDPASADPFVGRAMLAVARDDEAAASAWLDSALARNPGKWDALRMKQLLREPGAAPPGSFPIPMPGEPGGN